MKSSSHIQVPSEEAGCGLSDDEPSIAMSAANMNKVSLGLNLLMKKSIDHIAAASTVYGHQL